MPDPDPATVVAMPLDAGGLRAVVVVPTYTGEQRFQITVERDEDGDWRVYIPWFKDLHGNPAADHTDLELENGTAVTNGIVYLGAPEEDA